MKRTRRPSDPKPSATPSTLDDARLADVKGGASMVEYALIVAPAPPK
jgi:hypothetical protein